MTVKQSGRSRARFVTQFPQIACPALPTTRWLAQGELKRCFLSSAASVVVSMTLLVSAASGGTTGDNILIIVADDFGVDMLGLYGEGTTFPPTPTIDNMYSHGVLFRNAWSTPICSPTRATLQTGRYGFRTGVGSVVQPSQDEGLPFDEYTIPEVLDLNPVLGYVHAAIGKWHLTSTAQGASEGPNLSGYSHFSGTLFNLNEPGVSYFNWPKVEDGATFFTQVYATTDNVNEAIEWINAQGETPWFLWLAFNAPHEPLHAPPEELHSYDLTDDSPVGELYRAMVEAMDTEIGRLFDSIPDEIFAKTDVIFLGDNGTPSLVTQTPFDPAHAKSTLYEGGINVPLIISGPRVVAPGRESDVLCNTVDVFATVMDFAGSDYSKSLPEGTLIDSVSLFPVVRNIAFESREFVYSESFDPLGVTDNHGQTARNGVFKLIRFRTHPEEFYDLVQDPFETNDLLLGTLDHNQQTNYDSLASLIDSYTDFPCEGDANGDLAVDPLDVGFILARMGCTIGGGDSSCGAADQNDDGVVDPLDTGFVMANFGACE